MDLLSLKQVTDKKQAELSRDIARIEQTKKTLERVTKELNETNARFEVALANQRVRWSIEEGEATHRISGLNKEIKVLEDRKKEALIPIEEREKKSHTLLKESEEILAKAHIKLGEADTKQKEVDELCEIFENKIDSLSSKETDYIERSQRLEVKEKNFTEYVTSTKGIIAHNENVIASNHRNIALKEVEQANFDKYLKNKASTLDKREQELNNRETAINDKYNTILKSDGKRIT